MKKISLLISFLFLLVMLSLAEFGFAEGKSAGYPSGGMVCREVPAEAEISTPAETGIIGLLRRRLMASNTLTGSTSCVTGTEYSWVLADGSATAETNHYEFSVAVLDGTYADPNMSDIQYLPKRSRERELSYTFYFPGKYVIFADAFASEDSSEVLFTAFLRVTVTDSGNDNAVKQQIREVAATYQAEDDFDTALGLHDWVIDHCEYDHSKAWYSAESLFLYGTGVCNSYVRAYALLLEAAGIPCQRVTGYTNGNPNSGHAWIAAKINGEWYLIDPTWDDQTGEFLRHAYFAVNEELLDLNHTAEHYTGLGSQPVCTALDENWFVHGNRWQEYAANLLADYSDKMDTGWHRFKLEAPIYANLSDRYHRTLLGMVAAYGLSHTEWIYGEGKTCTGDFDYSYDTSAGKGYIIGKHTSAGTLVMPAYLEQIEADSFADTEANIVVIGDYCISIGSGAFAGMDIWELVVGSKDMEIAEDAFGEIPFVYVICAEDSIMWTYAQDRGWVTGDGTDYE